MTRFWVNDETRYARATMGETEEADARRDGFREVTGEEWDAFRAETREKYLGFSNGKGKRG